MFSKRAQSICFIHKLSKTMNMSGLRTDSVISSALELLLLMLTHLRSENSVFVWCESCFLEHVCAAHWKCFMWTTVLNPVELQLIDFSQLLVSESGSCVFCSRVTSSLATDENQPQQT